MTFARLFDRPGFGQVLAKLDTNDDGAPELRWYAEPPGLGVCSIGLQFEDSDKGWDSAERALADADEAMADKAASALFGAAGAPEEA